VVVESIREFQDITPTQIAGIIHNILEAEADPYDKSIIVVDADGCGEGAYSALVEMESDRYSVVDFRGGRSPSEQIYSYGQQTITGKQKFLNQRGESYWCLSERFRKTHEYLAGIAEYLIDELISIPSEPQLIKELSTIKTKILGSKIGVVSKRDMKDSPDFADALMMCLSPVSESTALDWIDRF
jgi:hypothetical protein